MSFSDTAMVFHEIAVEPTVIRTWRDFQCIWRLAGFGKGRLIANFPKKGRDLSEKDQGWAWRVLESVKANDIGKAKRVQERLIADAKFKMLRSARVYDHDTDWVSNARIEHRRSPFSAMIVDGEIKCGHECGIDDLEDDHSPVCLRDDQHMAVLPKHPKEFADALLPMLSCARELRFIDAYYLKATESVASARFSVKHAKVVGEIARRMNELNRVPKTVEFHMVGIGDDSSGLLSLFANGMEAYLPTTWKATAYLWKEKLGGRSFHARYVLTDVGGVGSDYGLDQGNSPGDQTDLYLLTELRLAQLVDDFAVSGGAFNLAAGPLEFVGIRG